MRTMRKSVSPLLVPATASVNDLRRSGTDSNYGQRTSAGGTSTCKLDFYFTGGERNTSILFALSSTHAATNTTTHLRVTPGIAPCIVGHNGVRQSN